jgi:non-specific serine/threonine protein kinase
MKQTKIRTAGLDPGTQLLNDLALLPAGKIYVMAPRDEVLKGMALLKGNPVRDFTWSSDRSVLTVEVDDLSLAEVSISITEGKLSYACDCKALHGCSHLVSALVTLKKILSPGSFSHIAFTEGYQRELAAFLSLDASDEAAAANRLPFRLVVERNEDAVFILPWIGNRVVYRNDWRLTEPMKRFIGGLKISCLRERIIEVYLELFGQDAIICWRQGGIESPLRFEADRVREARTLFDFSLGRISITKTLEDGIPLDDDAFAVNRYYFDIPSGKIQVISDTSGWRLWNAANCAVSSLGTAMLDGIERNSKRIALDQWQFQQLGLCIPENKCDDPERNELILQVNGLPASPCERSLSAELRVSQLGKGDEFALLWMLVGSGASSHLSSRPFGMLTETGLSNSSPALRTKKRFASVVTACFDLLSCTSIKEETETLKAAFAGDEFVKRKVKGEAKDIVSEFAHGCAGVDRILLTDGGEWLLYSLPRREQARLLEITFRIFGPAAFASAAYPGELRVSRQELMPRLPELKAKVEAEGRRLLFNGKPVRTVKWEFIIDATRSSIDWFELKPEVHCDGTAVKQREIIEALSGDGIYRRDDEFVMLDTETSAILSLLPETTGGRKKSDVVRIPRLRIFDWLYLRKSGVTVRLPPEDERIFNSLISFESMPECPLPPKLKATLRHYQADGYRWLAFLYTHRFGACLADDMGLGKTIQAISLLAGLREGVIPSRTEGDLPHLIVVPPSLLFNWESEIERFYPELRVVTYRGVDRTTDFANVDVVLTSYGIVQRDAEKLETIKFHVIIFDEAQAVKNIQTETTSACRRLKGHFTLILTGTPVENHLGEYYSIMDIAVPGLLGDYEGFRSRMTQALEPFLEMLIRRTRPFILRRSKTMIAAELPPKIETDIYLELTDGQKALYTRTVAEVRKTVADAYKSRTAGQARIIALTAILRLRQICLSSEILLPKMKVPSPKVEFLLEQLAELFDEGHSVLIFSQFTSFLNIVEREMAGRKQNYLRLDGSTPVSKRKSLVASFQNAAEPTAFLLSLKAGGRGLNLTRATYVFHLDPWWNPAVENQASDRTHRIGQSNQVTITRLVMRHTIEEKMMELKKRKLALYRALLEDTTTGENGGISREDFDFLLS